MKRFIVRAVLVGLFAARVFTIEYQVSEYSKATKSS